MKVGRKQGDDVLITSLACGASVELAAQKAGMSERSAYRRLENPQFQKMLRAFRTDLVKRTSAMLTASSMEAVKTLLALMERTSSPSIRLGAARSILELSMKLRESEEVEIRLSAIEAKLEERFDKVVSKKNPLSHPRGSHGH